MRLTQRAVDKLKLPSGKNEAIFFDDEVSGLGARLQGNSRRWIVQYRACGRQRRMTLGPLAGLSLVEARRRAGRIISDAREGKDVQAERARIKARKSNTLVGLFEAYIARHAEKCQRPRTLVETRRYLLRDWAPLHERALNDISREEIASHGSVLASRASTAGRRAVRHLGSVFSWAMRQGLVQTNPTIAIDVGSPTKARERVLSRSELAMLWLATADTGDYFTIVRLLILTGQRRQEVAGMRWSELDLEQALWLMPGDRVKNGRTHEVPIAGPVLELIQQQRHKAGRDLLFGAGDGAFSGWSRSKQRLDGILSRMSREADSEKKANNFLQSWTLHDIRRSVVTHMAEIGVEPHVIEAVVNHVSGHRSGIAGVYNRASYRQQKKEALRQWADFVTAFDKEK